MPTTTVVLPYGGGPGTVVVPGADAVSHTELAALSGVYVSKPAAGTTAGYVPTVQADGSIAYTAPAGGGGVTDVSY